MQKYDGTWDYNIIFGTFKQKRHFIITHIQIQDYFI